MSLIKVTNLTFAYEGSYDNIFDQVSFQIDTDWKLGFTGRNGRGKRRFLICCSATMNTMAPFLPMSALNIFHSLSKIRKTIRWISSTIYVRTISIGSFCANFPC